MYQYTYVLMYFASPWTIQSMDFSRPEYWSGSLFPSPGDLPNPGIKPRSPELQVDSLPAEDQGSPRILEWVAYPFSSGSSQPRNRTRVSCIAGGFFTNWAIWELRMWVKDCPNLERTLGKFLLLKTVAFVFLLVPSLFDTFSWLGWVPHLTRLSD